MTILNATAENIESTCRRLFENNQRNSKVINVDSDIINRFNEQVILPRLHAAGSRLVRNASQVVRPLVTFGNVNRDTCPTQSCIGKGVADILVRRTKLFTFEEACAILCHFDPRTKASRNFIEDIIRKYGIVIIGLRPCAEEDLILSVYIFFEDMFGITLNCSERYRSPPTKTKKQMEIKPFEKKPNIEMCVKITDEFGREAVGVVFDCIRVKDKIASNLHLLDDSGIEINTTFEIDWILDELCNH